MKRLNPYRAQEGNLGHSPDLPKKSSLEPKSNFWPRQMITRLKETTEFGL